MPKYDLITEDIKWCEAHRTEAQKVYQDGFISGLNHALWLMKSRPNYVGVDRAKTNSEITSYSKYENNKVVSVRKKRPPLGGK